MGDICFLALFAGFGAFSWGLIALCDKLARGER